MVAPLKTRKLRLKLICFVINTLERRYLRTTEVSWIKLNLLTRPYPNPTTLSLRRPWRRLNSKIPSLIRKFRFLRNEFRRHFRN